MLAKALYALVKGEIVYLVVCEDVLNQVWEFLLC
jgi:uncharacterized protein YuzB (UPF0349 family)